MLIALLMAVICALLASRRGHSWWKWGLGGAVIYIAGAVLLALGLRGLGIEPRFGSGTNLGVASALVGLAVPPIVAVAVVYRFTRPRTVTAPRGRPAKR